MKKVLSLIVAIIYTVCTYAQAGGGAALEKEYQLFDFSLNASRLEAGITAGQVGSFTDRARFGLGAYAMYNGFYLDFIKADPQHKYDSHLTEEQYHDNAAFSIHAGYQIPILKWLRIMPLAGYTQTNEGVTDGKSLNYDYDSDGGSSWYHDYTVTPGSRLHYFNYGAGLSVQPSKWFSINLIASRYALYGGIGLDIMTIAKHR